MGMPSHNNKPPEIWKTHGISGHVFVNPRPSSSSPFPRGFNLWISNVTEDTSLYEMSERQNPDTALDPRCQSRRQPEIPASARIPPSCPVPLPFLVAFIAARLLVAVPEFVHKSTNWSPANSRSPPDSDSSVFSLAQFTTSLDGLTCLRRCCTSQVCSTSCCHPMPQSLVSPPLLCIAVGCHSSTHSRWLFFGQTIAEGRAAVLRGNLHPHNPCRRPHCSEFVQPGRLFGCCNLHCTSPRCPLHDPYPCLDVARGPFAAERRRRVPFEQFNCRLSNPQRRPRRLCVLGKLLGSVARVLLCSFRRTRPRHWAAFPLTSLPATTVLWAGMGGKQGSCSTLLSTLRIPGVEDSQSLCWR